MPCPTKEAQAASARKHYLKNKDKLKARAREWTVRNNNAVRNAVKEWKVQGCQALDCNEVEVCCLQAHHVDPTQKDFDIGVAVRRGLSVKRVRAELEKCVCLCANCHMKLHAGIIVLPTSTPR